VKAFLFELFRKFFKKELAQVKQEVMNHWQQHQMSRKRDIEVMTCQQLVGQPVIYISNEVDNLVVGFVSSVQFVTQAQQPMLLVHDYISDKEVMVHNAWPVLQSYSAQSLQALMMMDRNSMIALFYGRYRTANTIVDKGPANKVLTAPQILGYLQKNGFYKKMNEYRLRSVANARLLNENKSA
jgi:hypothetical protein